MQKIIVGIIVALCIIGIGTLIVTQNNTSSTQTQTATNTTTTETPQIETQTQTPTTTTATTAVTPTTGTTQSVYTLADVAKHATATSCWAAINKKVYDLTKWIPQHPGGPQRILSICGKDGSSAFNGQHGGQSRPESELANYYIGLLQ